MNINTYLSSNFDYQKHLNPLTVMESSSKLSLVSRKLSPKQKKKSTTTNKPIKVRYISNPMKVQTCASKFRELVQELTGQDAVDLPPEEPFYSPSSSTDNNPSPPPCTVSTSPEDFVLNHQEALNERVVVGDCYEPLVLEEMLLPQMSVGGFSGFLSNNGFYNVNDFGSIGV